ncbi:hypothetical protein U1Q18_034248 [Sarracenia purpurea var. burkii]
MAKTFLLIAFYTVSILFLVASACGKSNGLTLPLIHPNSPDSPLFLGNLPYEERIRRLVHQSNALTLYNSKIVRPQIKVQSVNYIVRTGIGTFNTRPPHKEYYLEMDSGSSLPWMQCQGCTKCFRQIPQPFPKSSSKSFRPVLLHGARVFYNMVYADNTYTSGFLAKETFYFTSKNWKIEKVENITFGCGLNNSMEYGFDKNNKIAGIMGLGWGPNNFVDQIGSQSDGKFSYCLPVMNFQTASRRIKSYLRFGKDIPIPKRAGTLGITGLYKIKNKPVYYLNLEGISLNGKRLDLSSEVFGLRGNGNSGGCTIDSGMGYSRIVKPAYDVLLLELDNHFSRNNNLKRYPANPLELELCYEREKPEGFKNLPNITFHFRGARANLALKPEGSFEVIDKKSSKRSREYFCLAMLPDNKKTSIGAHQQTNHRIIYDTKGKQLSFYPENCMKNS